MQPIDRRLGLGRVRHLDKAKAAGTAGVAIGRYPCLLDGAKGCEQLRQLVFGRCPSKIADKDI